MQRFLDERHTYINTWKLNGNVSIIADVLIDQKRVNVWAHSKDGAM